RRGDAIAVVSPDGRLSYGELHARADRLAAHLRSLGVGPEVLVGLFLERSAEALVGILGVLKAGGAYLPLDPAYPRARLAFMLEDSGVPVVLTRDRLAAQLPPHRATVVRLDAIPATSPRSAACTGRASNLAYAIYTSGSTGRPKGVLLAHRGVCEMAAALAQRYDVTASSRVLLWASLSFDAAVAEIFTTLLAGGTLCLATAEDLLPGPDLVRFLRNCEVTNLTLVPSALQAMPAAELPALRSLVVAGEACRGEIVAPWVRGRRLVNAYGPTEATVCTTAGRIIDPGGSPSIGRPVAASRVYVLDRHLAPTPIGVPGELAIGGAALARGYLGRPELTAARFLPDPCSGGAGERLYRSGDLVRFLPGGELEFLGRIDQQVKIRGFRIELGEIEAVLDTHPGVRESVVVAADQGLAAYLVRHQEAGAPDTGTLRAHLRERLPEYMVPAALVFLDSLPRSPSGKVDRAALSRQALPEAARTLAGARVGPRDPLEEVLAGIWSQVLGVAVPVGVHDNFFELGGHSLLATQVTSRVRAALRVELPLRVLFERPTVAGLAGYVAAAVRREQGIEIPALRPVAREHLPFAGPSSDNGPKAALSQRSRPTAASEKPPLSFAQQRLWFL
ncbi:MAG: amino acid adenylation domain-containing protein, partial [bacterium]|nr:amino acid adenylation domain-containing protein [bacterium]